MLRSRIYSFFRQGHLRQTTRVVVWLFAALTSPFAVEAAEVCEDGWHPVGTVTTVHCINADGVEHTASAECVGTGGCCSNAEARTVALKACWEKHGVIAQPIVDPPPTGRFGLDLTVGAVGLSGFNDQAFFAVAAPRFRLHRNIRSIVSITVPLLVFGGTYNAEDLGTVEPLPGGGLEDQDLIAVKSVRVGPAWGLVPSIEYTFRATSRLQPAVFLGIGIRYEQGGDGRAGERRIRVPAKTEGLLSYGASLNYRLSRGSQLRFEARGITILREDRIGQVAGRGAFVVEEDAKTGLSISVGASFAF